MQIHKGESVSGQIAKGPIMFYRSRLEEFSEEMATNTDLECDMLKEVCQSIRNELEQKATSLRAQGQILEADVIQSHSLMLQDEEFIGKSLITIKQSGYSARHAIHEVGTGLVNTFEKMEDDFFRDRAADVRKVLELVLNRLGGAKRKFPKLTKPSIIVTDEIIPEEEICFEKEKILALVMEQGSYYSHSSILARLWNIPAVVGIGLSYDVEGMEAYVDGDDGYVYIEPDENVRASLDKRIADAKNKDEDWF